MPNQRKRSKAFLGGYMPKALVQAFKDIAKTEAGGDGVKLLNKLVAEGLQRRGVQVDADDNTETKTGDGQTRLSGCEDLPHPDQ